MLLKLHVHFKFQDRLFKIILYSNKSFIENNLSTLELTDISLKYIYILSVFQGHFTRIYSLFLEYRVEKQVSFILIKHADL